MNLKLVTLTGADDSIEPLNLVELSKRFEFVEWGILMMGNLKGGANRFPSVKWIEKLLSVAPPSMNLCAHLCGTPVKDALIGGNFSIPFEGAGKFQRTQINTHGAPFYEYEKYIQTDWIKNISQKVIFQCDGENDEMFHRFTAKGLGNPLFDTSSGAGILPEGWPKAWQDTYCGYAGGLGPSNVVEELSKIEAVTSGQPFWIDMETRVRSRQDRQFDLNLCESVLSQVKPYIE